eukprot:TRINITY_DN19176_c0_g1_i2.p1 TRINITY_DN19176_c0_g1~~TRINITY_DN19176_c0_g1_i2.p1  ORF type:complete len:113 (+),score=24.09 TRINITY_DN19176_c0_g1_i2:104-442(+)
MAPVKSMVESRSVLRSADPRMPSAAKPYKAPIINPDDLPPDYSSLLAILFGIVGVMLRHKWGPWVALLFCVQSLGNMKNYEHDLKQIVCAATFAIMGMMTIYFGPAPPTRTS